MSVINLNGQKVQIVKQKGSLLEDARDRDFTMNALYFDLNELKVKDPIGCGLRDIT
jgi:tRNA nucleotidyltransferase/poly(A) polymerase